MLRSRIIPALLLHQEDLVKTVKFSEHKYIGDPINTVRIFNEKQVDELIVLDISASESNLEPNYSLIEKIASECRMPLCYGGGIRTVEHASNIIKLGVEKVALGTILHHNPQIISKIANVIGNQSIVGIIDIKKSIFGKYHLYSNRGKIKSNLS